MKLPVATKALQLPGACVTGCFPFFLVQPGNVVVGELLVGVECDQVPSVGLDALALQAGDDAVELAAILGVDAGPEHLLGRLAVEGPIAIARLFEVRLDHAQKVGNLAGEQRAVLKTNLLGRALEVHVDPAVSLEPLASREARGGRAAVDRRPRRGCGKARSSMVVMIKTRRRLFGSWSCSSSRSKCGPVVRVGIMKL